jgi:hypothetical protein
MKNTERQKKIIEKSIKNEGTIKIKPSGKRKRSLRKNTDGNRHKLLLKKREGGGERAYSNRNGKPTVLNHLKHMLFKYPYKNNEYNKDLVRFNNEIFNKNKGE